MVEEKAPPRTVKVVDKRRFTAEGEPRDDAPSGPGSTPEDVPSPSPNAAPSGEAPPPNPRAEASNKPADDEVASNSQAKNSTTTSPEFIELIATLAQQAEMLLVGAEGVPAEPEHARRIIDYLVALESKTTGNVSSEEQHILSNVVFQLRSLFLQRR